MARLIHSATACAAAALILVGCGGGGAPGELPGTPPPSQQPPAECLAFPEISVSGDSLLSSEWNDVAVDWRGRVWLVGYDRGVTGQGTLDPSGDARAVVRVLSRGGDEELFDIGSRLDTPGTEVAEAVTITPRGAVYVAGRTTGVLAGTANRGQFDMFIARGDATHPVTPWRLSQFGDEYPQHPRRIQSVGDSDLYVAGYDDDYVPTNFVQAWADSFLRRLSVSSTSNGAPVTESWIHQNDTQAQDFSQALLVDGDQVFFGGVVTGGSQRGIFVRKLTTAGVPVWTTRYALSGSDNIAALAKLADGSILVAGSVFGSFRGGEARGEQDIFIARINPADGAVLSSAQLGTGGSDWLSDAKVDSQGNVYLFGETSGSFVSGRTGSGQADLFLLKVRQDGTVLRSWQWGTTGDEHARSIALDACGRALGVGSSASGARRRAVVWFPQGQ